MDYPEQEEWDFLNGQEALSVQLYKASTGNLLAMIDAAKEEIEAIKRALASKADFDSVKSAFDAEHALSLIHI